MYFAIFLSLASLFYFIQQVAAPELTTGITAYAQSDGAGGRRFLLEGPDPRLPGGGPSWPMYSRILTRALEGKGYVPDGSSPELVIRVRYRVGDTQVWTTTTSTPITGITGTETHTIVVPGADPSGAPTVVTTTTPVMGVVGTSESSSVSSTSMRIIQVEAMDAGSYAAGKPAVVWSVRARSRGAEDNLEKVFPVMVAAMEDYFGVTATREVRVTKGYDDAEVSRLGQP